MDNASLCAEAEKIAFEVAQINNEVPKDLNDHINDTNFSTKRDIQNTFEKNVEQLQAKASNIHNNSNIMHVQNIEQTFSDNKKIKNLDQVSDSIKNKTKEIQDEFNNTSNSAVILTGKQAVEASTNVLKAVKSFKDNK